MAGTSHEKWVAIREGRKRVMTVDCYRGEVRDLDVKSIIAQAGDPEERVLGRCGVLLGRRQYSTHKGRGCNYGGNWPKAATLHLGLARISGQYSIPPLPFRASTRSA